MRHQLGHGQGAGVWPRAFVLQDSSLRLCHRRVFQSENQNRSLSQTNPKVIMFSFENVWEVNKKLLSKRFSLAGKGGGGLKGPDLQGHLGATEEEVDSPL